MELIRIGVLTVSDRVSSGEREDAGGPAVEAALPADGFVVVARAIVPDDELLIREILLDWSDSGLCDAVITTGGTGLSPRDVTPEATRGILERDAPHIASYIVQHGAQINPFAVLSRAVSGIRRETLIVNLPGSPKGAREGTLLLARILPHAVDVLRQREQGHPMEFPHAEL